MFVFARRSLGWFACLSVFIGAIATITLSDSQSRSAAADDTTPDLQTFMRKKLAASSQILEGLTVEDPALIRQGTATLLEMSKVEKWNVLTDADYRDFNRDFRTAVRKLDEAAAKSNLDNAMLQWMDAMKGCVECHKYVRSQRPVLKK